MNLKKYFDAANAAEARVQSIAAQINEHFESGNTEEALKLRPELDKAKNDAHEAHQLYLSMQSTTLNEGDPAKRFVPTGGDLEPKQSKDLRSSDTYRDAFFKAFKSGVSPKSIHAGMHPSEPFKVLLDALTETGGTPVGSEGGFLLPVDFDNMIKEMQRLAIDLAPYVNVEEVTAYSGWRAIETAKAALPFAEIDEADFPAGERIPAMESPTFTKVDYTVKKYGGYLPVSNDLTNDTPANIMGYISRWCGRKVSLTNTSLILAIINALSPINVTDWKTIDAKIKTVLNKTLDPAISAGANIFCNQTGFDLLDQLLDGTGRPILAPDPTNETVKRFKGRQVIVLSDVQYPNLSDGGTFARIAVGDGRELVTLFRRMAGELAVTTIGGTAWRNDNTEVRYILREVAKKVDADAMALLKVTVP